MPARLIRVWEELAEIRRRYGLLATLQLFLDRILNLLARVAITNVLSLRIEDAPSPPNEALEFECRLLTADEVRTFAADPANDIKPGMADRIARGRDLCFGALVGTRLASSCWFALGWVEAEHTGGIAMSYPKHIAYGYKAFTHPDFRGRRISSKMILLAIPELARHGITELMAHVRWINYPSLRAYMRIRARLLGRIVVIRRGKRQAMFASHSLKSHGLRFGAEAETHCTQGNG